MGVANLVGELLAKRGITATETPRVIFTHRAIIADMARSRQKLGRSSFAVEFDREEDGRWIAEVPSLPGVMAYGATKNAALRRVSAVALRTLADKVEQGRTPMPVSRLFDYEMAGR